MRISKERKKVLLSFWKGDVGPSGGLKRLRRLLVMHAEHCVSEGFPFGSEMLLKARNSSWDELFGYADALCRQSYLTPRSHYLVHQFYAIFKKYPFPPGVVSFDPEAAARRTYLAAERRCMRMNKIIRMTLSGRYGIKDRANLIHRARDFVSYVLGDVNLNAIYALCDFGSGASIGVHGDATHVGRKIDGKWSCTSLAVPYVVSAVQSNYQLCEYYARISGSRSDAEFRSFLRSKLDVVLHNKIAFVPKTAKTLRSIAVEPSMNTFVQKGIDSYMRQRLRRVGIDLADQSINSRMAQDGSLNWNASDGFCTIDLSSASDTMSRELVKAVLPADWYDLLNRTRSHFYKMDDRLTAYQKFCSMGNGFCFPLQTLIFASLCHAVRAGVPNKDFHVYGDDIVCRAHVYGAVIRGLKLFGFIPNKSKSFGSGPFRESCGEDWHTGELVRPYVVKQSLGVNRNLIAAYNLMLRNEFTRSVTKRSRGFIARLVPHDVALYSIDTSRYDHAFHCDTLPLDCPNVCYNAGVWSWMELADTPLVDRDYTRSIEGVETPARMYSVLRGGVSHNGDVVFTLRRKTKTRLTRKSGVGATSLWLPPKRL